MMTKDHGHVWLYMAILVSAGQVALVWWHRFLPIIDYPNWLFQAKILADLAQGGSTFGCWYSLRWSPVPNSTFTIAAALLGQLFAYETAGKIILSIAVLLLPWGVWFAAGRFGAVRLSAVRYFGFPFGLNMFTLGSQNYTLALGMLIWFLAVFLHPSVEMSRRKSLLMPVAIVVVFLTHGVIYFVLLILLFWFALGQPFRVRLILGIAVAPSLLLGLWYLASSGAPAPGIVEWGWTTLARHLVKPACLFLKSHGVVPLLPPTFANLAWLTVVVAFVVALLRRGRRPTGLHRWLVVSGGMLMAVAFVLPDFAFGILQPGGRAFMPALFLLVLSSARSPTARVWKFIFIAFGGIALIYNASLFTKFSDRATEFTMEARRLHVLDSSFCVIAVDWAEDAGLSDRIAPSSNGMSFVPVYGLLNRGLPHTVFETGLVKMNDSLRGLYPAVSGSRIKDWVSSTFANPQMYMPFHAVLAFGDDDYMEEALRVLSEVGFTTSSAKPGWRIFTHRVPSHARVP
jgi:hypothetical protein